jgi:hypothetical protein
MEADWLTSQTEYRGLANKGSRDLLTRDRLRMIGAVDGNCSVTLTGPDGSKEETVRNRSRHMRGPGHDGHALGSKEGTDMKTMMALRAHRRGGPEELVHERAAVPVVGPQEVLVAVHGAAITLTELTWNETWTTENGEDRTPVIPSHELSGVVVQLGADVKDLSVGEGVFGLIDFRRDRASAKFTALPGAASVRRPTRVSHVEAAAVPLAALTALQAFTFRVRPYWWSGYDWLIRKTEASNRHETTNDGNDAARNVVAKPQIQHRSLQGVVE